MNPELSEPGRKRKRKRIRMRKRNRKSHYARYKAKTIARNDYKGDTIPQNRYADSLVDYEADTDIEEYHDTDRYIKEHKNMDPLEKDYEGDTDIEDIPQNRSADSLVDYEAETDIEDIPQNRSADSLVDYEAETDIEDIPQNRYADSLVDYEADTDIEDIPQNRYADSLVDYEAETDIEDISQNRYADSLVDYEAETDIEDISQIRYADSLVDCVDYEAETDMEDIPQNCYADSLVHFEADTDIEEYHNTDRYIKEHKNMDPLEKENLEQKNESSPEKIIVENHEDSPHHTDIEEYHNTYIKEHKNMDPLEKVDLNSYPKDSRLRDLVEMGYSTDKEEKTNDGSQKVNFVPRTPRKCELLVYGRRKKKVQENKNKVECHKGDLNVVLRKSPRIIEKEKKRENEVKVRKEAKSKLMEAKSMLMNIQTNQFIARMDVVQGPRNYIPLKGSVVDSLVGVILTQNVKDQMSSKVFMKLVAKFPVDTTKCSKDREFFKLSESDEDILYWKTIREIYKEKFKKKDKPRWERLKVKYTKPRPKMYADCVDWNAVRLCSKDQIESIIENRGQQTNLALRIMYLLREENGTTDFEWLRYAPQPIVKEYLNDIFGFGEKSTACVQLLTLKQCAFPVDKNVSRITIRLGWFPLPKGKFSYPHADSIQDYLWQFLCELPHEKLYELHYHMITFGKVFCTEILPNCKACPMKVYCKYYASSNGVSNAVDSDAIKIPDIEDIARKCSPCKRVKRRNESQSIVPKKTKFPHRTEHLVYELPNDHQLLRNFEKRESNDVHPYLLLIGEPGEMSSPPIERCQCKSTCSLLGGTILIPCVTAVRERFPLNGTYFQPNEVFADHDTSKEPIVFSSHLCDGLVTRSLYCGSDLENISKSLEVSKIRKWFAEGYVCVRAINRKDGSPQPLAERLL